MTTSPSLRFRIQGMLGVGDSSKPTIYLQMFDAAQILSLNYVLGILLSAGIATFGLVLDSPAVVIGAMLISPLMGPILAAGLALAAADLYLGIRSLLSIVVGVALAASFAALLVWLLPFQQPTHEIIARTNPNLLDLGIALLSGLAGAIVVCRGGGGGGVTALPGVAIAVALMPPVCTIGFGMGSGFSRPVMSGAGLLFLTNLAAIIASAFLVFYLMRMESPEIRSAIHAAIVERESQDPLFAMSKRIGISKAFGDIGSLRWRILMLAAVLGMLFFPLRQSLFQLRDEVVAQGAVGDAIRIIAHQNSILSRQVDAKSIPVLISLVVTSTVPPEKIAEASKMVFDRTGHEAKISVRKVAGEEELARLLRERINPVAAPVAQAQSLSSIRADLLARLEGPLKEIWPTSVAPLVSREIGFDPDHPFVRLVYGGDKPLDKTAEEMVSNLLRSRLQAADLKLLLEYQKPPSPKHTAKRLR